MTDIFFKKRPKLSTKNDLNVKYTAIWKAKVFSRCTLNLVHHVNTTFEETLKILKENGLTSML